MAQVASDRPLPLPQPRLGTRHPPHPTAGLRSARRRYLSKDSRVLRPWPGGQGPLQLSARPPFCPCTSHARMPVPAASRCHSEVGSGLRASPRGRLLPSPPPGSHPCITPSRYGHLVPETHFLRSDSFRSLLVSSARQTRHFLRSPTCTPAVTGTTQQVPRKGVTDPPQVDITSPAFGAWDRFPAWPLCLIIISASFPVICLQGKGHMPLILKCRAPGNVPGMQRSPIKSLLCARVPWPGVRWWPSAPPPVTPVRPDGPPGLTGGQGGTLTSPSPPYGLLFPAPPPVTPAHPVRMLMQTPTPSPRPPSPTPPASACLCVPGRTTRGRDPGACPGAPLR